MNDGHASNAGLPGDKDQRNPEQPAAAVPPDGSAPQTRRLVAEYRQLWQFGRLPRLMEYFHQVAPAADPPAARVLLVALVQADLECRWAQAEVDPAASDVLPADAEPATIHLLPLRPRIEDYTLRVPLLAELDPLPVLLIAAEYRARLKCGGRPEPQEFFRRFPGRSDLRAALAAVDAERNDTIALGQLDLPDAADPQAGMSLDQAQAAFRQMTRHVMAYRAARDAEPGEPPELGPLLPAGPASFRRLVLIELIKHDLACRWSGGGKPKYLEDYLRELPELGADDSMPLELLYEEYSQRMAAGDPVTLEQYRQRFPQQAVPLERLFRCESTRAISTRVECMQPAPQLKLGSELGEFELLRPLGQGAFAAVYLALQKSMQRRVALKVSRRGTDEPQTMAQLDHPSIVRVFDQRHLPEEDLWLLYMEYVPGGTLEALVERVRRTPSSLRNGRLMAELLQESLSRGGEDPLSPAVIRRWERMSWSEVVCRLGARLASALDYAHRRDTLHRDVKPANVLLTADGGPKLADFNISYSSKLDGATPAAFFGGSLAYMSPEQLDACNPNHQRTPDELDGRSDLYSLGILLWELLTGSRPFLDERVAGDWSSAYQALSTRRNRGIDAGAISELPADLLPGLAETLIETLAPRPENRPATGADLARKLTLCLEPEFQHLAHPPVGRWQSLLANHALLTVATIGLLPNFALSVVNVTYDWKVILAASDQSSQLAFFQMLVGIKAVLYTAGTLAGVWLLRLVFRRMDRDTPPELVRAARQRSLRVGDIVFGISATAWIVSGVIFPLWLDLFGADVSVVSYFHFLASHVLCGMIAGLFCFFLLTLLGVRLYYPRQLARVPLDDAETGPLLSLSGRVSGFGRLAVAVPFVAALSLGLAAVDFRPAFIAMALLGGAVLALSYFVTRLIQRDLSALIAAATIDETELANGSSSTTSLLRRSR